MEEEQTNDTSQNANNNPPPGPPVIGEINGGLAEDPEEPSHASPRREEEEKIHKVFIVGDQRTTENEPPEDLQAIKSNRHARNANIISFLSVAINAILFMYTYLLFKETQVANETSKDALTQAAKANKISEDNFQLAKKQYESSDEQTQKSFDLTRRGIETQINTLKENQKEFEVENMPFISMVDFKIDTPTIGLPLNISFSYVNLGKFPAKLISVAHASSFEREMDVQVAPQQEKYFNELLSNYNLTGANMDVVSNVVITASLLFEIQKRGKKFHFTSFVKYENLASHKILFQRIFVEISWFPRLNTALVKRDFNDWRKK